MKGTASALKTHMAGDALTIAHLWKVTRTDATVYGFTDHDEPITYSGTTYQPSSAFSPSAVATRAELNVDDLELQGLLDSDGITAADIEAGLWDGAAIIIYRVNWASISDGAEIVRKGWLGQAQRRGPLYVAEMRGMMQALQTNIGREVKPTCDATLGDTRCGKNLTSFTHSATVTAVASRRQFTASALTQAAGYFNNGKVTFTGGDNSGLVADVKTGNGSGVIVLQLPMPFDIQVGDTLTAVAGCDKQKATCKATFNNLVNFRGFSYVPGPDRALAIGSNQ